MEQLTVVSGLYRLALNPAKQFEVRNLTVTGDRPDAGDADRPCVRRRNVGRTHGGRAARPRPDAIRPVGLRPSARRFASSTETRSWRRSSTRRSCACGHAEFATTFPTGVADPAGRSARASSGAPREVFDDYVGQTLQLDLTDLSRERWSLIPTPGDLIAEIRTRRLGSLTYARSSKDAEDITLFDRRRRRNIAVYASPQKLASRGRFYSEDELVEYDVLRYDVDAAFTPERMWVDGSVELRVRVRSYVLSSLTLRLAEPLVVRSIVSPEHGRLLHLRVVGQNSVIVNFPDDRQPQRRAFAEGRLRRPARAAADRTRRHRGRHRSRSKEVEQAFIPIEPQYIYSNRSYWYPQATVTDYAPARLRVTVPAEFDVVASGTSAGPPTPTFVRHRRPGSGRASCSCSRPSGPMRYLACVISRFNRIPSRQLTVPIHDRRVTVSGTGSESSTSEAMPEESNGTEGVMQESAARQTAGSETTVVTLSVQANPRQTTRARGLAERAASIFQYYGWLVGDAPYPSFTLAVTENESARRPQPAVFRDPESSACRPRHWSGATIPWHSTTIRRSSWPTRSHISGGVRPSAGRTITSSG